MAIPFLFICSWFDGCRTRRSTTAITVVCRPSAARTAAAEYYPIHNKG